MYAGQSGIRRKNGPILQQRKQCGQAYITMTYTLGSVIGAFLGGALIDFSGVNTMLLFATISAAVGAVIIFFGAEKTA